MGESDTLEGVEKDTGIVYEAVVIEGNDFDGIFEEKSLSQPTEGSAQKKPIQQQTKTFKDNEIAIPTFDIDLWASMMEFSTRLAQCVRLYARNTVGLGWKVTSTVVLHREAPDDLIQRYELEKMILLDLLLKPNADTPFSDMANMVMTDRLLIGNGYIEVVRNRKGDIVELYHAKARTIRVLKNSEGFVQLRGNSLRYFKHFGDKRNMNMDTGKIEAVGIKKRATEMIHLKEYNTVDDFYGVPRYKSTAPAIMGNRAAAERNLNFFRNDAVPRMALTISGGKLSQNSVDTIQKFFKASKGIKNAHRMMIIQVDSEATQFTSQAKPDVQLKPLTVGETDDASFQNYRMQNDEEVREAFGIAKAFFTPDDVNKAVAYATKEITNEQEFDPTQKQIEHAFYHTIIVDMFSSMEGVNQKDFQSVVSKAKGFLLEGVFERIQRRHFSDIFFSKSSLSDEEMCNHSNRRKRNDFVVDVLQATGLMKFSRIRKDSSNNDVLMFESLPLVKLQFERPKVLDEADKAEVHEIYLEGGVVTPNEVRQELGLERYPDDLDFGDTPIPYFDRVGVYTGVGSQATAPDSPDGEDSDEDETDDVNNNPDEGDNNNE